MKGPRIFGKALGKAQLPAAMPVLRMVAMMPPKAPGLNAIYTGLDYKM